MVRTAVEAREQLLADLATAIDQIALATACLGQAYDQLDDATADRLEAELFRPVQKAFGRAKRAHAQFAAQFGLPARAFEPPSAGLPSQGVKRFVERAVAASAEAGQTIAGLQDSMLPIEVGDPELRAGLAEVRELVEEMPGRARAFLRTLGR
ncbi:MAG TPA: hypothetical protein VID76_02700 [Solirubrobacterales bacterium]|jgi:hypothetical protein